MQPSKSIHAQSRSKAAFAVVVVAAISFSGIVAASAAEKDQGSAAIKSTVSGGNANGKAPELVAIKKLHMDQLTSIKAKLAEIKALRAKGDFDGAKAKQDELKALREQYRKAIEAKRTAFQATHGSDVTAKSEDEKVKAGSSGTGQTESKDAKTAGASTDHAKAIGTGKVHTDNTETKDSTDK